VKARPRLPRENPGRGKPTGGAGERRAKPPLHHKALSEGLKPRNRGLSGRPGASAAGNAARCNGMWVLPGWKRSGYLLKGETSEG
jgi:hypothetical protein